MHIYNVGMIPLFVFLLLKLLYIFMQVYIDQGQNFGLGLYISSINIKFMGGVNTAN